MGSGDHPAHRRHGGFPADAGQVGSQAIFRRCGQQREVDVVG